MEAARKLGSVSNVNGGADAARDAQGREDGRRGVALHVDRSDSERVTFAELDRSLKARIECARAGEPGLVFITAPPSVIEHAACHARRRLEEGLSARRRGDSSAVVFVSSSTFDGPWREAAREILAVEAGGAGEALGASFAPTPKDVGEALSGAPHGVEAVLIVERELSTFGRAVLETYASSSHATPSAVGSAPACIVLVFTSSPAPMALLRGQSPWLELDERMDIADAEAWWECVTRTPFRRFPDPEGPGAHRAASAPPFSRLADLEAWWSAAQAAPAVAVAPTLPGEARELSVRLSLAARTWPESAILALSPNASTFSNELALRALADAGFIERKFGAIGLTSRASLFSLPVSDEDRAIVRAALAKTFRGDAVAAMRGAEIAAETTAISYGEVDSLALSAIRAIVDAEVREDLWARYDHILRARSGAAHEPGTPTPWVGNEDTLATLLAAGDVALAVGDVERAVQFAQKARGSALSIATGDVALAEQREFETLLLLGRAQFASGDLTTATLTIGRAVELSQRGSLPWGRAAVALSEVRYQLGELGEARELALSASEIPGAPPTVRLGARNVVGKVLLARAQFEDADKHFAADASDAACIGDSTSELRARLNRAIALMSQSRYVEARAMLDAVREAGEERRELRAVCFALGNLATIAVLEHRYADALDLLDRTIEILRRVGDKPRLAVFIANLAELRLRLGLDREAEQVLLFGRRVCGVSAPVLAQLSLVSARVQLVKGKTAEAYRELSAAISPSGLSFASVIERHREGSVATATDGSSSAGWAGFVGAVVGEAFRLAARAALEEGDTEKARIFIDFAATEGGSARIRAEISLLRAMLARSLGDSFVVEAAESLRLARDADEDDHVVDAHVLCHLAGAAGDHLSRAHDLRNAIASTLPAWVRERYLTRRNLLAEVAEGPDEGDAQPGESAHPSVRPSFPPPPRTQRSVEARSIVGSHSAIRGLLAAVRKVGASDTTVLIHGESGTGKELVADAIHDASLRRSGPLVKVNCAALVETLLLSELFGHEKGAFTGAGTRRRGRFEAAEGGTLFLDEIGDISHRTQVALLRVLQEKTFERVGGTAPIRANVRVVCATHRDLRAMVARGEFREDLYYRLCGMVLEVPALRERVADVGSIANALLARIAEERGVAPMTLSSAALFALQQHSWPGNVRELENALRAASLFAETSDLQVEDFCENVESLRHLRGVDSLAAESGRGMRDAAAASMSSQGVQKLTSGGSATPAPSSSPTDVAYAHIRGGVSLADMKRQIERDCIARAIGETDGNITRAAVLLGMKRPRLSQLVKQYGLGGDGVGEDVVSESEEDEG